MTMTYESRMLIDGKLDRGFRRRHLRQHQPGDRSRHRPGRRRERGRHGARDHRARAGRSTRRRWSTDKAFRKACLLQLKDALDKHKEDLRPQIVAEVGAPIGLTYAIQQDSCIDDMQWDIDLIDRYEFEYELGAHEFFGMSSNRLVVREPIGVVGAITPWNFPFMLNLSKLTPALAAGCTVILKPAPDTPYSATWIGKLVAEETDIPPGVFNVVTSADPALVGDVLTGDPRVDMISFTGSTAVGKHIAARGAGLAQAGVPRARRQVGQRRARRRRLPVDAGGRGHGVHALRSGLRDHDPRSCCRGRATTKASRSCARPSSRSPTATRPTSRTWPAR